MKKDKRLTIALDEVTKFLLEGRAKAKNMTVTELVIEGGLLYGRFDQGFVETFKEMAVQMGIKDTILLQNLVLNQIAIARQFEAIFGRSSKSLDRVFRWKDGKMLTGDELLEKLNNEYKHLFSAWKTKLVDCHQNGNAFKVSDEAVEILAGVTPEQELRA